MIEQGIADVEQVYERGTAKREGAVEGFDLCRTLDSQVAFERVLQARRRREQRMVEGFHVEIAERVRAELGLEMGPMIETTDEAYWRHRWATLQIEFVYGRLLPFFAAL